MNDSDSDLTQAENAMIAAGTDLRQLAAAQHRHAEAIRNMMQGVLVPSFLALVDRVLDQRIQTVVTRIDAMLDRLSVAENRCTTCPLKRRADGG